MSISQLNVIAGKLLATASTLPYNPCSLDDAPNTDQQVRESNEGIERLLAAVIGYAYAIPTEQVPAPKLWFGEQYGKTIGTLVSLIGEHRILNPELIAMGAQGAWLYRYATAYDLTLLTSFGQVQGTRVAGLECISNYCVERDIGNAAFVLTAIDQMGKMVRDFHEVLLKDESDA